jgi:hypothetical protein
MAPTSCFTGQVHTLPNAPEAYGAMITCAKAAPGQSRYADLVEALTWADSIRAMKHSMIALVSAGAIALTVGGYTVGSTRLGDSSEPSAKCESVKREFETRAAQIRKQVLGLSDEDAVVLRQITMIDARVKIVSAIVDQHPRCFDAGTRAAVAVLRQDRSEGEADVATCDLTGIRSEDCMISTE